MNDFKCKKIGPTQAELQVTRREDTFVDGTEEGPRTVDISEVYTYDEIAHLVDWSRFDACDYVTIKTGTLRNIVKEYRRAGALVEKVYEALGQ